MNKTILTSVVGIALGVITLSSAFAQDRNRLRDEARRRNGYYRSTGTNPRTTYNPGRTTTTRPNRGVTTTRPHTTVGTTTRPPRGTSVYAGREYRNRPNVNHSYSYNNRPQRRYYGTSNYSRPYGYNYRPYTPYVHSPYRNINYNARRRYLRTANYYNYVRQHNRNYLYMNWIFYPSTYSNGYHLINDYPYYVYNGYQNRYSNMDQCNYQLVDSYTQQVVRSYYGQVCSSGYDSCSYERDNMNRREMSNRYFCSETFREQNYNFSYPTYDYGDNYFDYDDDYYYNDQY